MSDQGAAIYCPTRMQRARDRWLQTRHTVGFWLYCYVYARFIYRAHMRLLHRHGKHWWTHLHPIDGARQDWCQWCGARRRP